MVGKRRHQHHIKPQEPETELAGLPFYEARSDPAALTASVSNSQTEYFGPYSVSHSPILVAHLSPSLPRSITHLLPPSPHTRTHAGPPPYPPTHPLSGFHTKQTENCLLIFESL